MSEPIVRLSWTDADALRMLLRRAVHEPEADGASAEDLATANALLSRLEHAIVDAERGASS